MTDLGAEVTKLIIL